MRRLSIITELQLTFSLVRHLLTLEHRGPSVVDPDLLVVNFKVHGGKEDSGRVILLVLVSGLPGQDHGVVRDADGLEVPDGRGETDGPLLVAENDLSNVGKTLLEVRPSALLVD